MFHGKSWQAPEFGTPTEVLRLTEATWEAPSEGRLLVKVDYCAVGYPDIYIVGGHFPGVTQPPASPGQEVSGEVVAVAPGSPFAVGDRVMGMTPFFESCGGYGTYAYVWEAQCRPIPSTLTGAEAAGFLIGFKTAHFGLVGRLGLTAGEVLVVLGGAGGSGSTAIQLGKALGATVIAVAGGHDKVEFCRSLGADHVIDRTAADVAEEVRALTDGRGADVVYDPVGGDLGTQMLGAMAYGGRFGVIGYASGSFPQIDGMGALLGNYSVVGVFGGTIPPEQDAATLDQICELAERGAIKTPIGTVFSFDDVPDAIQQVMEGRAIGKAVVRVAG
ncbi:oxidoreductase [Planotetraspora thailandica]|uniref:Oxidoreductase n=1 Tax=Planotetraspora thailandica TaxID=487172 RepID=A0A8J3UW94_9ACTN|nr:NADPH:quinone oxidoreductase family protein [Planotetraspora thailandica]GII52547.1 oxidoreductase [Planotetraspora thailandica]